MKEKKAKAKRVSLDKQWLASSSFNHVVKALTAASDRHLDRRAAAVETLGYPSQIHLQGLGGETDSGGAGVLEDDELGLEEDITEDVDTNAGAGLETTVAG